MFLLACGVAALAVTVVLTIDVMRSLPHGESFYDPVVAGQVYRSRQPNDADWAWMRQHLGIRTVIDLRGLDGPQFDWPRENAGIVGAGMKHICIPLSSRGPTDEEVNRFLQAIDDPGNRPALMHCEMGRVRSGVMVAVYRMEFQGWPNQRAVDEFLARLSPDDDHAPAERFIRTYTRRRTSASQPASRSDAG